MSLSSVKNGGKKVRRDQLAYLLVNSSITTAALHENTIYKKSNDMEDKSVWERLLKACDNKAYSQKELDAIGDKITTAISPAIRPIFEGIQAAGPYLNRMSEKTLAALVGKTAGYNPTLDRRFKLSKFSSNDFGQIYFIEKEILELAADNGIYADSLESLSSKINFLEKKANQTATNVAVNTAATSGAKSGERAVVETAETAGSKAAGKAAGKSTGLLPFVGLVVDLTLAAKNLYEAWINGKKIITKLPISKYGISTAEAIISTPGNTRSISRKLENSCLENVDSPENLFEILDIAQTMKGYATDFVSAITNSLMSIIDSLEIAPVLGSFVAFLLSIPLVAVEIANDTIVEESYEKIILMIKEIAINKLGLNEDQDISFSEEDREFASSLLSELGEKKSSTVRAKELNKIAIKIINTSPIKSRSNRLDYFMRVSH